MAIQTVPPIAYASSPAYPLTSVTVNAAGERTFLIGQLVIPGGGTATISSAGGRVLCHLSAATFANAGTTVRIGVQDVTSAGYQDDTFDTYADLTGGGGGLVAGWNRVAMTTGSKTLSHGDVVAVGLHMTARGGSDSIISSATTPAVPASNGQFPYRVYDIGAGNSRSDDTPLFYLESDAGTLLRLFPGGLLLPTDEETNVAYNSSSSPNEYAVAFTPTVPIQISRIGLSMPGVGATPVSFSLIVYEDPYGSSPTALATIATDTNYLGTTNTTLEGAFFRALTTPLTLAAGTTYAVALKPTTTSNIRFAYQSLPSGIGAVLRTLCNLFGSSAAVVSRTTSGAFSLVNADYVPHLYLSLSGFSDGAAGSGGARGYGWVG